MRTMQLTSLMRTILYKGIFRVPRNNIATSSIKMQEALEDLKNNPYFDKYASKISQLQKRDPDQFISRIVDVSKKDEKKTDATSERQYAQLLNPKKKIDVCAEMNKQSLDKIMKTDLVEDKNADEIEAIWQQYHIQKEYCISASIPHSDYDKLMENSKKFPIFVFALPRSQGYEFIMCQFALNTVHFTPLLYYQVHKENAPECLTITHYDELKESKGIVLMRGEYDKNVIDAQEAKCLANQLQLYYVQEQPEKKKLLETFTANPEEFKHIDLIKQIETLSL